MLISRFILETPPPQSYVRSVFQNVSEKHPFSTQLQSRLLWNKKKKATQTCTYSCQGLNNHPLVVVGACGRLENVQENLLEEHLLVGVTRGKNTKLIACPANRKRPAGGHASFHQ